MKSRFLTLALSTSLLAAPALAQAPAADKAPEAAAEAEAPTELASSPDEKAALALAEKYLTAVKAKKWNDAKKLLHPETHKAIAERKKRLGVENHPMAPWYLAKEESWLKDYKINSVRTAPNGTVVIETTEDNFQVQEKGLAEGEKASYLVGKKGGKLYMADKKREQTFTDDSIKYGYKGWFDGEK